MALTLTADQQAKVDRNRKPTPPSYYDSTTGSYQQISADFEAYLILASSDVKNSLINELTTVSQTQTTRKDRDALLTIAFNNEIADSQARLNVLNNELGTFNTFRDSLDISGFESVVEIGAILNDIQLALGEDILLEDRTTHLNTYTTYVQTQYNGGQVSSDLITEIQSWIPIIQLYLVVS